MICELLNVYIICLLLLELGLSAHLISLNCCVMLLRLLRSAADHVWSRLVLLLLLMLLLLLQTRHLLLSLNIIGNHGLHHLIGLLLVLLRRVLQLALQHGRLLSSQLGGRVPGQAAVYLELRLRALSLRQLAPLVTIILRLRHAECVIHALCRLLLLATVIVGHLLHLIPLAVQHTAINVCIIGIQHFVAECWLLLHAVASLELITELTLDLRTATDIVVL